MFDDTGCSACHHSLCPVSTVAEYTLPPSQPGPMLNPALLSGLCVQLRAPTCLCICLVIAETQTALLILIHISHNSSTSESSPSRSAMDVTEWPQGKEILMARICMCREPCLQSAA